MSVFNPTDKASTVELHHDFEFVDAGLDGLHFISVGCVAAGPSKSALFYGINKDFFGTELFHDMTRDENSDSENNTWMFDHVFKHIKCRVGKKLTDLATARLAIAEGAKFSIIAEDQAPVSKPKPTVVVGTVSEIKEALLKVVAGVSPKGVEITVQPWGYYTAHDHVLLANIFGGMRHMPDNWRYYSIDVRQLTDILGQDHDDFNPNTPHHPLYDAVAQFKTARKMADLVSSVSSAKLGALVKG
jgi:hypothetical protein